MLLYSGPPELPSNPGEIYQHAGSTKFRRTFLIHVLCALWLLPFLASAAVQDWPSLTPAPMGPYHVLGNRILDSNDQPYLIRGTDLARLNADHEDELSTPAAFGPLSPTTIVTIRQRLNMNAVRVIVSAADYQRDREYGSRLEKLVRLANSFDLLVILACDESTQKAAIPRQFWTDVAQRFRNNPNLFFAPMSAVLVPDIRRAGAHQPVVVRASEKSAVQDPDVIYQLEPQYATIRTDEDRRREFGSLAGKVPVIVDGMDPQLDLASDECAAFPRDPAEASALVERNLVFFDEHRISWTLSSFTAGKLITDYRYFNGTKLDAGWTCGKPSEVPAGLGLVLLSHLWNTKPLDLFTVSESRGGMALPRGGISSAYGPILADEDMNGDGPRLPTVLGNVSVRITDSKGMVRLAPLLHTGAGWSEITFVIPDECATGPAQVDVVRTDGSVARSKVLIADVAPGIFTAPPDGRSIAIGEATQHRPDMPDQTFPIWECGSGGCRTVPIPLSSSRTTTVRLRGMGFRHAGERASFLVTVGGLPAKVLSFGAADEPGNDQLVISIPDELRGAGETDVYFAVNGELSNVARINFGSAQ